MNRKTKSFLLALYFFLSSSCYGCSKSNDIDIEEVVSTSEVSNEELLNTIGTEPIIETIETLPIEHTVIETEPIVETEPIFETEPVIETEPAITPSKTLDEIALEVIGNKYGYGDSRINGVISQGFDYYEVEKRVYEILAGAPYSVPDRNTYYFNFAYTFKQIPVYDSNGNVEGNLSEYQKVLIINETEECYFVAFNDQTFYVKKENVKFLADSFIELDISEQKLYMFIDGVLFFEADVITGHPNKGATLGTNLGVTQVYAKSYDVSFEGGKKSKYFILFNWDTEGFHDANWREDWEFEDKTRYIFAGSNGCCNMKLEDVMIIDEYSYIGMPVLCHK